MKLIIRSSQTPPMAQHLEEILIFISPITLGRQTGHTPSSVTFKVVYSEARKVTKGSGAKISIKGHFYFT